MKSFHLEFDTIINGRNDQDIDEVIDEFIDLNDSVADIYDEISFGAQDKFGELEIKNNNSSNDDEFDDWDWNGMWRSDGQWSYEF